MVVISYPLWQASFGGDPEVLGFSLRLEGENYTIVGVSDPSFVDPVVAASPWDAAQLWRAHPPVFEQAASNRTWRGFWAVGRLAAGLSIEDAASELWILAAGLADRFPESNAGFGFAVTTVREQLVGDERPAVLLLLVAVSLLLLVACTNVDLLLSRAAARRPEIALRTALGASRWRIIRQLLLESLGLAIVGGLFELGLACFGTAALTELGRVWPTAGRRDRSRLRSSSVWGRPSISPASPAAEAWQRRFAAVSKEQGIG